MVLLASDGFQGWELLVRCQHVAPGLSVPLCAICFCVQQCEREAPSILCASVVVQVGQETDLDEYLKKKKKKTLIEYKPIHILEKNTNCHEESRCLKK